MVVFCHRKLPLLEETSSFCHFLQHLLIVVMVDHDFCLVFSNFFYSCHHDISPDDYFWDGILFTSIFQTGSFSARFRSVPSPILRKVVRTDAGHNDASYLLSRLSFPSNSA